MSNRLVGDTESPAASAPIDAPGTGVAAADTARAGVQRTPPLSHHVVNADGAGAVDDAAAAAAERPMTGVHSSAAGAGRPSAMWPTVASGRPSDARVSAAAAAGRMRLV